MTGIAPPGAGQADEAAALALYRARSAYYDLQLAPYEAIRRRAIEQLRLEPGQTVLDIGCGTGMSLGWLQEAVGPEGRVIAVDQSPEMLEQACARVTRSGWCQVDLLCSPVQQALLPERADALLLHFTHDILQTPVALDHLLAHLKPGARIAVTGLKWASPLYGPLNALVWWHALQSVTTLQGLDTPWEPLLRRGVPLEVEELFWGAIFLASGPAR